MSKKIAVFGGSGQTGKAFIKIALEKGYILTAMVRNPEKLDIKHPNLKVLQGDILKSQDVNAALQNNDMVISLFGHVKDSPEWLQTNGTKNIIAGMKTFGIKKIISLSGGGLPFPEKDEPKLADRIIRMIMKIVVPKILNDAIEHHKILVESGLSWTIVRGPRLTNDAPKGTYRIGWVGVNASTKIARVDLAEFISTQIESDAYLHQMPFVSY